ncbi:MAG TPA: alpha/beta hydrolase [Oculatellaceae cyanobacterium]
MSYIGSTKDVRCPRSEELAYLNESMKLSTNIVDSALPRTAKPDVVFIHGTGSNSQMWSPQVEALSRQGHKCFLIDLRGHGKTPEVFEPTNLEVHKADVLETLEDLNINYPCIFIGHSLGAIISMELAQIKPDMFERVFAVGLPGRVFALVVVLFRIILRFPYEKLRGTSLHKMLPWRLYTLINTDRYTLTQIADNFQSLDYVSNPFNVKCPVHFSAGRFDPVAPFPYVKRMHQALPHSTLEIFELAGHNHMDQYPRRFNHWLSSSLTK